MDHDEDDAPVKISARSYHLNLLAFRYLHSDVDLLLVWCQVVTLGQEHFPKGSLAQLPLQHNVVPLDVLDNFDRAR